MKVLLFTLLTCLALSGCNGDLSRELEDYQLEMEDIHELDETLQEDIRSLELEALQDSINMEEDLESSDLDGQIERLENEILPGIEELEEEITDVEVENEEINTAFSVFEENVSVKSEFIEELHEYLTTYQNSLSSNQQLIELSQSFMSNQDERNEIIENTEGDSEAEEVDDIIDQVNQNGEALEEETQVLQSDESLEEKQSHIDNEVLPLIDDHIDVLNEMILETQEALRVRSLTLEMYYGFKQYYEERKKTIRYNNILQETQLQNILPMKETYEKLTEEYYETLEDLEDGE